MFVFNFASFASNLSLFCYLFGSWFLFWIRIRIHNTKLLTRTRLCSIGGTVLCNLPTGYGTILTTFKCPLLPPKYININILFSSTPYLSPLFQDLFCDWSCWPENVPLPAVSLHRAEHSAPLPPGHRARGAGPAAPPVLTVPVPGRLPGQPGVSCPQHTRKGRPAWFKWTNMYRYRTVPNGIYLASEKLEKVGLVRS